MHIAIGPSASRSFFPGLVGRRAVAEALPQRALKIGRTPVLFQQIAKGFVREFLEIHHTITGKQVERLPCLIVELNTFAGQNINAPSY